MKTLLITILTFASINLGFAQTADKAIEAFNLKQDYEEKAFELKVLQEREQIIQEDKIDFDFYSFDYTFFNKASSVKSFNKSDMTCPEWVYKGPGSREEAIEACRGVNSLACLEWVYKGPGSRKEAARACKNIKSIECAQWVYKGPGSRIEALEACRGVKDMDCVEFAYKGPGSRKDAARTCAHSRSRPDRDNDRCE